MKEFGLQIYSVRDKMTSAEEYAMLHSLAASVKRLAAVAYCI